MDYHRNGYLALAGSEETRILRCMPSALLTTGFIKAETLPFLQV
jgi:hypothetical protein